MKSLLICTSGIAALLLAGCATTPATGPGAVSSINFGDDSSAYANDSECDDPRFEGDNVSSAAARAHLLGDATDCRAAVNNGTATYTGELEALFEGVAGDVDYGDNSGTYVDDDECDDPRFSGAGVSEAASRANAGKDAHDCRAAVRAGEATYNGELPPLFAGVIDDVDYGDNSSSYAEDGECDDARFEGENVSGAASRDHTGKDAHDCRTAVVAGTALYKGELPPLFEGVYRGVDFGSNSGSYIDDGECDDRRFRGFGMATPPFSSSEEGADAADCQVLFADGFIRLVSDSERNMTSYRGVSLGSNLGDHALNGVCEDPRFRGPGMGDPNDDANKRDATDCGLALKEGSIKLNDD